MIAQINKKQQLQDIASDILSRVTTLEAQTQALTEITGESKEYQGVSYLFFGVVEELQRIQKLANELEALAFKGAEDLRINK